MPNTQVFHQESLGIPTSPTPAQLLLRDLAEEYANCTERYDRTVCTGPIIRGEIMPSGAHERGLINRHARAVFDELLDRARLEFPEIGSQDLRSAVADHRRN